jgi:hypothetical protein
LTGTITAEALTTSGNVTLSGGTANGVAYLNGSKVLTTGSALTFDGTNLAVGLESSEGFRLNINGSAQIRGGGGLFFANSAQDASANIQNAGASGVPTLNFILSSTEQMRLTSTGLGIGTSSPGVKLDVVGVISASTGVRLGAGTNLTWGGAYGAGIPTIAGSSGALLFYPNGSTSGESMRLDSSGNLGLGVTPSAWASFYRGFDVSSFGAFYSATINNAGIVNNGFFNGTNWIYKNSANAATNYQQTGGAHQWFTAPSGTAGNAISFTQAMTLDASGNLVIGGTGFAYAASGRNNIAVNGTGTAFYELQTGGVGRGYLAAGATNIELGAVGYTVFTTNGSERARIDSSGSLLIGTTSAAGVGVSIQANCTIIQNNNAASSGFLFQTYRRSGVEIGYIDQNGTTAVRYSTTSDYRLKEDVLPMTGALAKVAQLKPCTYKWKVDGSDGEGFIAHELAEVCPQAVTRSKDAVDAEGKPQYQGIDTSFLVATLTAAIQEQQALIQTLTARVAALESN